MAFSVITDRLRESGVTPIVLPNPQTPEAQAATLIAALSCDLVVVELPAAMGLDAQTPRVWELLGLAGIPRVIVVAGLGAETADFDDIAAIAQRVLGEDAVPVRLPVLDDDEQPVASFDLCRGVIDTQAGQVPAETGHLTVAAADLSALLSVVAATVLDDSAAATYVELLAHIAARDEPPNPPGSGTTMHLGMPTFGPAQSRLPERLAKDVADAVGEGLLTPIVAHTAEEAWLHDLRDWSQSGATPSDRLVRRDAEGEPADGWAAVVLAIDGETALIRPVFGQVVAGFALITAVGSDEAGSPVPHRAWPTELTPVGDAPQGQDTDARWWATTVRMSVGDTVASGHVWLVPSW